MKHNVTKIVLIVFSVLIGNIFSITTCRASSSSRSNNATRAERKLPKRITLYYLPFDASTFRALNAKDFPKHSSRKVITNAAVIAEIYGLFDQSKTKAKIGMPFFNEDVVRLLIIPTDTKKRIMVDQEGNASFGRNQVCLSPFAYLRLYLLMRTLLPDANLGIIPQSKIAIKCNR